MKRNSFVFYASYKEALDNLPPEQQLNLYKAICQYAFNGKFTRLTKQEKSILNLIIPTLDSSMRRYDANVENGKKGGRPKKENTPLKNPPETQTKPNENPSITQSKPNSKPKQNLNYNDNENYNYNIYNKQDKTKQVNRIEEKNNQVQSSPDKKIYFYEILTNKNKKLQEKNLEDSAIFNRLQNLFDQMNKETVFTTNQQSYKMEDIFKQLLELYSGNDNEVIERITSIFTMVDNNTQVINKYKYTIITLYQQAKEMFVNLPKDKTRQDKQ